MMPILPWSPGEGPRRIYRLVDRPCGSLDGGPARAVTILPTIPVHLPAWQGLVDLGGKNRPATSSPVTRQETP